MPTVYCFIFIIGHVGPRQSEKDTLYNLASARFTVNQLQLIFPLVFISRHLKEGLSNGVTESG